MELLSDVVARRSFRLSKRGFDIGDVESFVDETVERIRALEGELSIAHGKLTAFERNADAGKDAGLVVQDAFRVATTRRDEIIKDAEVRAAGIVAEAEARSRALQGSPAAIAEVEADVILKNARDEAGRIVVEAERRAREILRVARAEADQDATTAIVDAREAATNAQAEYRQITRQLTELKSAVNRMLQNGAEGSEEIRVVFASESASLAP
jgi:vacuolar-type H+-ATPase subunit H